jgi:hypothetical protein
MTQTEAAIALQPMPRTGMVSFLPLFHVFCGQSWHTFVGEEILVNHWEDYQIIYCHFKLHLFLYPDFLIKLEYLRAQSLELFSSLCLLIL